MPRPHPLLGAGVVLALIIGGIMIAGLVTQTWWLVAVAGWLLGSAVLLVQLDSWRRVRSLRRYVRDQVRGAVAASGVGTGGAQAELPGPTSVAPTAAPEDVVGAVRLLQAQYVGRLDRMQTTLDEALVALRDRDDASTPTG